MKYVIRMFLFSSFALWFVSLIFEGFVLSGDWKVLLLAGVIFAVLHIFIKPLLSILFIPINLITFGLFSWVINVLLVYILTLLVPEVTVRGFHFAGLDYGGFAVPAFEVSYTISLIIVSILITFMLNIINYISN